MIFLLHFLSVCCIYLYRIYDSIYSCPSVVYIYINTLCTMGRVLRHRHHPRHHHYRFSMLSGPFSILPSQVDHRFLAPWVCSNWRLVPFTVLATARRIRRTIKAMTTLSVRYAVYSA